MGVFIMIILTNPAIQKDNKNIRVYWNTDKKEVRLLITNTSDTKQIIRNNYEHLTYSTDKDLKGMIQRHIQGLLFATFNINLQFDNVMKLINCLFDFQEKGITSDQILKEIDNQDLTNIIEDLEKATPDKSDQDNGQDIGLKLNQFLNNGFKDTGTISKLTEFMKRNNHEEILLINQAVGLPVDLIIDFEKLERYDSIIADNIIEKPEDTIKQFDKAIVELITNPDVIIDESYTIRFKNLPLTPMNKLLSNKYGQMIESEAIVKGVHEPQYRIKNAVFQCNSCYRLHEVKQKRGVNGLIKPALCPDCGSKQFTLLNELSTVEDERFILLEEPTDNLETKQKPRKILSRLNGSITSKIHAGERIRITGILKGYQDGESKLNNNQYIIESNNITQTEDNKIEITEEELKEILKLSKDPDIIDRLIKSFAPDLVMPNEVKLSVICFLVKAGYVPDNKREMIHILLITDPSLGKTQLKEYAFTLTEKGIKTSGTNASGVGLTGAIDKDPILGTPIVQPGAIPLANNGHIFIDEMEKLPIKEQQKMLNYMESGQDTIDKWGLHETLHGATSILGLANPTYGRFDRYKTIQEQIKLYPPLQSRYDLIIVLEDKQNKSKDRKIAKSILNQYSSNTDQDNGNETDLIPFDLLKKYLAYARNNFKPEITEELHQVLIDYQEEARTPDDETNIIGFDWRAFESLIRLSGALAKLRLSDTINEDDLNHAIALKNYSLKSVGLDPDTGKIDIDRVNGTDNQTDKRNRKIIKSCLKELLDEDQELYETGINKGQLFDYCREQYGLRRTKCSKHLNELIRNDEIISINQWKITMQK